MTTPTTETLPPKRGRGRPRKVVVDEAAPTPATTARTMEAVEKTVSDTRKVSTKATKAAKSMKSKATAKKTTAQMLEKAAEKIAPVMEVVPGAKQSSRILQEVAATGTLRSVQDVQDAQILDGHSSNGTIAAPAPSNPPTSSKPTVSAPQPTPTPSIRKPHARPSTIPLPPTPKKPSVPSAAPAPLPYRASQPPPAPTAPTAPTAPKPAPNPKFQYVGVEPGLPPPLIGTAKARPISPYDGEKLPPKYRKAAWRVTAIIVGLPVVFVTSYELWRRFSKDGWVPQRKYGDFQTQRQANGPLTAGSLARQDSAAEGSGESA